MSVRIEINQVRSVEEGPLYRVNTSVISASGIDRAIFVFNVETQLFGHVATTWDMENLSNSRDTALVDTDDYYRAEAAIVDYTTAETATAAALYTRGRVQFLATQYDVVQTEFEGSGDYTYLGE